MFGIFGFLFGIFFASSRSFGRPCAFQCAWIDFHRLLRLALLGYIPTWPRKPFLPFFLFFYRVNFPISAINFPLSAIPCPDVFFGTFRHWSDVGWDTEWPAFKLKLGAPDGPATQAGTHFTRSFEHLTVSLNCSSMDTTFDWKGQ